MKRITLVLFIVLAFVGYMAFAEDTKTIGFSGAVEGGAKIAISGSNMTIQQFTNNEGTSGWANLSVAATLGNFAANFYLRSSDFTTWTIPNAWITEKLLDGMIELRAGSIDNGVCGTANQGWGGVGGMGIQAVLKPIADLAIGLLIPAPLAAADLVADLQSMSVGASYAIPSVANIAITYNNISAGTLNAGVNVTAVSGLTLQIEAQIPTSASPTYKFFENVAYAISPLTIGVNSLQTMAGSAMTINLTPNVTVGLAPITLYAQIGVANLTGSMVISPQVSAAYAFNAMATAKVTLDLNLSTSATTININFIHNF
jgi:hypothetical protein